MKNLKLTMKNFKKGLNFEPLIYFIFLLVIVSLYLSLTSPVRLIPIYKITEGFSEKPLSEYRENLNKIIIYPDNNDRVYVRLFNLITNEPAIYRHDIIKIKELTSIDDKSRVLEAGCGLGKHLEILKELVPGVTVEGIDKSRSMIHQSRIRNPGSEFLCTSLRIPEIYKEKTLSHILCLHETLNHNTPKEMSKVLTNFHKWLVPGGYLAVHIWDPNKLDPAPRAFSQYFKAKDGTKHALTYFESFTHEAWWEKETDKKYWYKYCEKYIFPSEKVKIHTTPLWIPPVNKMLEYITRHQFKLTEIVELDQVEISDFTLYIFRKK